MDYIDKATGTGGYTKLHNMNGTPESGYYQNGVHCDGVDDRGEVYSDALSTPHENFTIETAFDVGENGGLYWYLYDDTNRDFIIIGFAEGTLVMLSNYSELITIPVSNMDSTFIHVIIVSNENNWKIYVNGKLCTEVQFREITVEDIIIGGYLEPDPPYYAKTTFYTFRIYQRALTEEEINQNHEAVKASIEMEE